MAEQGYPDYEQSAWSALVAPAGTPPAVLARLNDALNQALRTDGVVRELRSRSQEPLGGAPQDASPDQEGTAPMGKTSSRPPAPRSTDHAPPDDDRSPA